MVVHLLLCLLHLIVVVPHSCLPIPPGLTVLTLGDDRDAAPVQSYQSMPVAPSYVESGLSYLCNIVTSKRLQAIGVADRPGPKRRWVLCDVLGEPSNIFSDVVSRTEPIVGLTRASGLLDHLEELTVLFTVVKGALYSDCFFHSRSTYF